MLLHYSGYRMKNSQEYRIFESITDKSAGNKKSILKLGKIKMYIPALDKVMDVELKPIVKSVDMALGKIGSKYSFMYTYIQNSRPMFVLTDPNLEQCIHKTMSVDNLGNLWLNVHFIYNDLDCNVDKIFGILFHELMHNFLDHLSRGQKILPKEERMRLYSISKDMLRNEDLKQNLCADMEVNCNMVADGVVTSDFWKEMKGVFDEKYFGKQFEEIYKTDGDELLKNYLKSGGVKISEEYLEALKAILEALRIFHNPDATEREKDIAASKLRDIIESLFGETKTKMTIRKSLIKLQKLNLKEIGEIGPYLKKVIDDLEVSPVNMTEDDLSTFINDVNILKEEMKNCSSEIEDMFNLDKDEFLKDNEECWTILSDGVSRLSKEKELLDEERDEITEKIIFLINKLISNNLMKDKLKEEFKKRMKEIEEKRKKKMEKEIEKKEKKHILYNYLLRVEDMAAIYHHERLDMKSFKLCNEYADIIKPLLHKDIHDINEDDLSLAYEVIKGLKDSFYENLKILKEKGILVDRDDSFFVDLVDRFYNDTKYMLDFLIGDHTETEIVSVVKTALSSLRMIGREFHRQAKVRPSEEYKEAFDSEWKRLVKIFNELGEKGLRRELGLPEKGEIELPPDSGVKM